MNSFSFLFLYLLLVVCGLFRGFTPCNDEKRAVIANVEPSLREFVELVAISFILGLSLREPKVCGNPYINNNS